MLTRFLFCVFALALVGCSHPWNVHAHAAINIHARVLAAVDRSVATAIREDTSPSDQLLQRWSPTILSLRGVTIGLVSAERAVEVAEQVQTSATKCQALVGVVAATEAVIDTVKDLDRSGLIDLPSEVTTLLAGVPNLSPVIAQSCQESDGGK